MSLFIGTTVVTDQYHYKHLSFNTVTGISTIGITSHSSISVGDNFGYSVAAGSGRIVVGAYFDDVSGLSNAGSAHIYNLDRNFVGIITHPSAAANDNFGDSVAVGCGRIVVGASGDGAGVGSVLIYNLNGNYVGIITNPGSQFYFGKSVAVGCGRIIAGVGFGSTSFIYDLNGNYVGILTHPSIISSSNDFVAVGCGRIVVGTYGDTIGIGLTNAGSAHIYDLNGNYVGILTHPSAAADDYFGWSVSVGSGRIVVGAYRDDIGAISNAGSALIYDLNGNYVGILTHPNAAADDQFGYSVAVGSGRIVVGVPGADLVGSASGSALIYNLNGNYVGFITHSGSGTANNDNFGYSVAVGSGRIVVGAPNDDLIGSSDAGSAHIYKIGVNIDNLDTYYEQIIDNYKY
jgi:hypothetical protein